MQRNSGIIIQIGGSGKGCGKTTLIERLLTFFPGAAFIKSALHFEDESPHGGDDRRCSGAGAGYSVTFNQMKPYELNRHIQLAGTESEVIFLERNRLDDQVKPDLYIFVSGGVADVRSDSDSRKNKADIIYEESCEPEIFNQILDMIHSLVRENTTDSGV